MTETDNKGKKVLKEVLSWVKVIVTAVIIALLLNHFVLANAVIPSGSMEPTVPTGARLMGLRLYYDFTDPERGDVVIFKNPDNEREDLLKRIIGMPGETVEIVDGKIYITSAEGQTELLNEPYLVEVPTGDFGPYEVPDNCYFMMGDHRSVSKDARYWENKYVSRDMLIAKAIFMYYPGFKLVE